MNVVMKRMKQKNIVFKWKQLYKKNKAGGYNYVQKYHHRAVKGASPELRDNISQDHEKSESLKSHMSELERKIEGVESKILHAESTLKELRKLQDQISATTSARSTLFTIQQKQYAALDEENEDTNEELQEWQTKFEERIVLLQSKINKLARDMADEDTNYNILLEKKNDLLPDIGKFEAEDNDHMSSMCKRDSIIKSIYAKHNLGSIPEPPFSNEVAINITNRIKNRLLDIEKDLQDKKVGTYYSTSKILLRKISIFSIEDGGNFMCYSKILQLHPLSSS